jgi:hypothetical protein
MIKTVINVYFLFRYLINGATTVIVQAFVLRRYLYRAIFQ